MRSIHTTRHKAFEINRDNKFYGSFAEIGAGQEVARHFFQAGLASQTVAKSMSAYDKSFSDSIYGKGSRFVSEDRLIKMLTHEYDLLEERLPERKSKSCFFAFANTVATSSHEEIPSCHGWMGVRFQQRPGGPFNDIVIHIRMLDRLRLQQQDALGSLGVNLIYAGLKYVEKDGSDLVASLLDNLSVDRIEINFIRFSGPDVEHLDNRLMNLDLVRQNITRAVMFGPKGDVLSAADILYKKPVLALRGTFRPVTSMNMKILETGARHMERDLHVKSSDMVVMLELTMSLLTTSGQLDKQDFLDRVDTLSALGHNVLISNFPLFAQLHHELRRFTDNHIVMAMGASSLPGLFDKRYYEEFKGGILAAFGQLCDNKTKIYVFPYKTDAIFQTADNFKPSDELNFFYRHLLEIGFLSDMELPGEMPPSFPSDHVRKLLAEGNPEWEEMVPSPVKKMIKERKLFGYNG